jgi:anti-sigma factor RsiW
MSQTFRCDTSALISYLYDDIDPVERDAVAAHLERCEACALDVATLGTTRTQLAAWEPPDAVGGFRVGPASDAGSGVGRVGLRLVTNQAGVLAPVRKEEPPSQWRRPLPGWAQAVAASMIFAAGLALGVSRGGQSPSPEVSQTSAGAQAAGPTVSAEDLARLERGLRAEIAGVRETVAPRAAAPAPAQVPDMRRVEALIAASEERQQRELVLRTVQLVRDFDLQRQADLVKIQQALGQFQGTTNAEVRQHRDAIEDLARRVSQTGR